MKAAFGLALLFAVSAHATTVSVDLQDPAAHLKLTIEDSVSINADFRTIGEIQCSPVCQVVRVPVPSLIHGGIIFRGWDDTGRMVSLNTIFDQAASPPPGPHAQTDFVYLDGPVVPANATLARFATFDKIPTEHWRLTGHIDAQALPGQMIVSQSGELSYYDAATNAGWILPYSDTRTFGPSDRVIDHGQAYFTILDGPTVTPNVPEPPAWALLALGLVAIVSMPRWRSSL